MSDLSIDSLIILDQQFQDELSNNRTLLYKYMLNVKNASSDNLFKFKSHLYVNKMENLWKKYVLEIIDKVKDDECQCSRLFDEFFDSNLDLDLDDDLLKQLISGTMTTHNETNKKFSQFVYELIFNFIQMRIININHVKKIIAKIDNDEIIACFEARDSHTDIDLVHNKRQTYNYYYDIGEDCKVRYRTYLQDCFNNNCCGDDDGKLNFDGIEFIVNKYVKYKKINPKPLRLETYFDPLHYIDYYRELGNLSSDKLEKLEKLLKIFSNEEYYSKTKFLSGFIEKQALTICDLQVGTTGYIYQEKINADQIFIKVNLHCHNEILDYEVDTETQTLILKHDYHINKNSTGCGAPVNYVDMIIPMNIEKTKHVKIKTDSEIWKMLKDNTKNKSHRHIMLE